MSQDQTEPKISQLEKDLRNNVEAYAIAKATQNDILINLSLINFNDFMQNTKLLTLDEFHHLISTEEKEGE